MLIVGVVLCAAAAGAHFSLGAGATDSEAVLAGIVGGQLPRDCVYVRFPEPGDTCAAGMETGPCDRVMIDPNHYYCTDATLHTSCTQEPKYCRERDLYTGDCATSTTDCTGTWAVFECMPMSPTVCAWELMVVFPCSEHYEGGTKPWCYEI